MILIHHNPNCGTSRNVLALIRAAGYAPIVNEYLDSGWTKPQLQGLFAAAGLTPRTALRTSKSPAKELGLMEEGVCEDHILSHVLELPVLVKRPIVCTSNGVKLCRPSEAVLELLEEKPKGPFYKEDGELLIDVDGNLQA